MRSLLFLLLLLVTSSITIAQDDAPERVYPYAYDGQWGLIDQYLNVHLEPSLDSIGFFRAQRSNFARGLAWDNGKVGLLNARGEWLTRPRWEAVFSPYRAEPFIARVQRKGRWGLVDLSNGDFIIRPRLKQLNRFYGGEQSHYAAAATKNGYGVVRADGSWVVPPENDSTWISLHVDDETYNDILVMIIRNGDTELVLDENGTVIEDLQELWLEEIAEDWVTDGSSYKIEYMGSPEAGMTIQVNTTMANGDPYTEEVKAPVGYRVMDGVAHQTGEWSTGYYYSLVYYVVQEVSTGQFGIFNREGQTLTRVDFDHIVREERTKLPFWRLEKDGLIGYSRYSFGTILYPARFHSIEPIRGYTMLWMERADGYAGYAEGEIIYLPLER